MFVPENEVINLTLGGLDCINFFFEGPKLKKRPKMFIFIKFKRLK
jgi:hypothetical protein